MKGLTLSRTLCLLAFAPAFMQVARGDDLCAIPAAESFIARNGYTVAGHPSDLPVQRVEVLDQLSSADELVKSRQGTLDGKAFGIANTSRQDSYYVLFKAIAGPYKNDGVRAVLVQSCEAKQVVHSTVLLENLNWRKIE